MKTFKSSNRRLLNIFVSTLTITALVFQIYTPLLSLAQTIEPTTTTTDQTPTLVIETGDAVSGLTQESVINTNVTDTHASTTEADLEEDTEATSNATSSTDTEETATSTPETNKEDIENHDASHATTQINVNATNTVTSTNKATSSAETGSNVTESGNFITETGDAVAYVDLVNVVNTNIINSTGLIDFIRNVLGYQDFDLRNTFNDIFNSLPTAESTAPCNEDICNLSSLFVNLANQANLNNDISVVANTGNNSSSIGSGSINTGNAYASANIVNLANTNIIDSNYLLLTFDNFADLAGSLVLPNSDFFSALFANNSGSAGSYNITNNATVDNNITTIANSGDNQITGATGSSTINTGVAEATSHTDNILNQNFLNTNSFSMLIRVQGTWSGNIFGLPEGMQWENTNDGIRLFYDNTTGNNSGSSIGQITNDANISNKVKVYALTGDNEINNNDNGNITTGNAFADSTIVNIANTNVVGSNWINLIFNIYGNWNGNLAFGQPDLWLGLEAKTDDQSYLKPSDEITYKYTVFNQGDTTAHNVMLRNQFPTNSLLFADTQTDLDDTENTNLWSIGDIKAGETKEITIKTKTGQGFGTDRQVPLPLSAQVYGDQPDANDSDNQDSLLLYVGKNHKSNDKPSKTFPANFVIEKTADKDFAQAGDTINYTVKFTNQGGQLYDSLLVDVLRNEAGEVINEQTWPLDTISNDETITITYAIVLPENITDGVYTNTAQVVGSHGAKQTKYRSLYESPVSKHNLAVGLMPEGEVLGISTDGPVCSPYLNSYLRQNRDNDPAEVIKLQEFLQQYITPGLSVSGTFDDATKNAVTKFQQQYADDILTPWGMTKSSGYVYFTTKKKINEIMCGGLVEFPLSTDQEKEIDYFKNNHNNINVKDWLFSGLTPTQDLASENQTEINNDTATVKKSGFTLIPYFTSPARKIESQYSRLNNWLTLFNNNNHTAFLN